MSKKTRPLCVVLPVVLMLCGLATLCASEPIPEAPRQKEAWKPPASKVPDEFVKAATLLFEQGLADPRGCEYRDVELTAGKRTHAWVLPAKDGDKQRFAVSWDGLVFPVVSVGEKADLKKDIRAPEIVRGWDRGELSTALLLRLGEGDLASELWAANHPPPTAGDTRPVPKESDPYLSLARHWGETQFDRALDAHACGDDVVALHGFRKLTAFAKVAEVEAKKHGFQPRQEGDRFLNHLGLMPDLLADQERRAREGKREAIVCMGPGRDADQQKRIAALVLRLDEVTSQQFMEGSPYLQVDPIVQALIHEGRPAVEPLLKCFESDKRLTRAVYYADRWCTSRECASVHDAASVALTNILEFSPRSLDEKERKQPAAQFREHIEKTKRLTTAERWFQVLADDNAKPDDWWRAATSLLSPDPAVAPRTTVWSSRSGSSLAYSEEKPKLLGESLRGKKAPSVTELLLKRIEQCEGWTATDLAMKLARWEPKAALEPLAELTKRLLQQDEHEYFVDLIEKRHELGDRKALDEYVAFIRTAHPKMLSGWRSNLFKPMADHPDHPGMAKAAAELFADEKSPWLPLLQKNEDNPKRKETGSVHDLIPTRLLRLPAFRNAVLKELANKKKIDDLTGSKEQLKEATKQDVRACDFCARKLSTIRSAPQCELDWNEVERDKAVAACVDFLRRQQYDLEWRKDTFRLDAPATTAQVENGQAVFSLAGAGEVRVVSGLKLPSEACWTTFKNSGKTVTTMKYEECGKVIQAEEVFKDGKWRRYYGFVGVHHVVRVPAEEIEFSPNEPGWKQVREWVRVGFGLHAWLDVPPLKFERFDDDSLRPWAEAVLPPCLPVETVLKFTVVVRNSRGLEQSSPDADKSIQVRLLYSPEIVSRQGALIPRALRDADWIERTLKPGAKFTAEMGKTLAATEEMKLATFDLRDWFDVSQPGFYRLQLLPASAEKDAVKEIGEIRFSLAAPERKPTLDPKP